VTIAKFKAFVELARPHQYVKNGFIFLPAFFDNKIFDFEAIGNSIVAFSLFCLVSSGVYIFNDLMDLESDKKHPEKYKRPLASGVINKSEGLVFSISLLIITITFAFLVLNLKVTAILLGYILLNILYSSILKNIPIVDISCIGIGFVLRIFAGAIASAVQPSHWIVIMTFLLALFLAIAKRRNDLIIRIKTGNQTRRNILAYNTEFISAAMILMSGVTMVSYIMYTVSSETILRHGTDKLYFTAFWVLLGIMRYLQLALVEEKSGSPTKMLLKDNFLKIVIFLWIITFFILIYI